MTRKEAPHYSYPKRDGYFADTKRMGRTPEAPMAVDVPTYHYDGPPNFRTDHRSIVYKFDAPFDWTETQGDLAPVVRQIERWLVIAALVMVGWVSGCLMALAMLKGWM